MHARRVSAFLAISSVVLIWIVSTSVPPVVAHRVGALFPDHAAGFYDDSNPPAPRTSLTALSKIYLPLVLNNHPPVSAGIYGRVTQGGIAVSGVPLSLYLYSGSSWSPYATTTTDPDGRYSFASAPSLGSGQQYYVRYSNPGGAYDGRLWFWRTRYLTSYSAGSGVAIGDFDIADISLVSPNHGAAVSLPYTFQWNRRPATGSDSYEFNLLDPADNTPWWRTDPVLGYVGSHALSSLPSGFSANTPYGWYVAVFSPDGGYGASRYYHTVTFLNAGLGPALKMPGVPKRRNEDAPRR
jgi:hypothetical protein